MTRTNVVLDDELVEKCQRVTGIQTRRSVIDHALRELLRRGNQKRILLAQGQGFMGWRPCCMARGAIGAVTLVDTTVWIDFFCGTDTAQVQELERMLHANEDVCVCGVVLTEVLQGIRDDKEYANTLRSFDAFILLPMTRASFVRASEIYRTLRRRGLTIRNAVDCMIAAVALEHDVALLRNDRDFDAIASLGKLKIVEPEKPTTPTLRRIPRRK